MNIQTSTFLVIKFYKNWTPPKLLTAYDSPSPYLSFPWEVKQQDLVMN